MREQLGEVVPDIRRNVVSMVPDIFFGGLDAGIETQALAEFALVARAQSVLKRTTVSKEMCRQPEQKAARAGAATEAAGSCHIFLRVAAMGDRFSVVQCINDAVLQILFCPAASIRPLPGGGVSPPKRPVTRAKLV